MICTRCGTLHDGQTTLPGSGWIELVLWLCWLAPGLIYSIWRRRQPKPTCSACGSLELVGLKTPVGRRLATEHYPSGLPQVTPHKPQAPAVRPKFVIWLILILLVFGFGLPLLIR